MIICTQCEKRVNKPPNYKYCSNRCQLIHQYNTYIEKWKLGGVSGTRGIHTGNISGYVHRYLLDKFYNKCSICGWNKKNPLSGNTMLEIDHIDGDSGNNKENNLRLLCPNCHLLTPYYKNYNKRRGREWRRAKYIKNIK